ncbi:MAG: hypothetical protein ACTS27_01745 [Phycisphaerales bacterium]
MNALTLATDVSDLVPIVVPLAGLLFVGFCVAVSALRSVAVNRAREQTKREVAAYMAEGSITSEDAERLLKKDKADRCW